MRKEKGEKAKEKNRSPKRMRGIVEVIHHLMIMTFLGVVMMMD
jgi:hypothetical protein